METKPLVSVILPTLGREEYVLNLVGDFIAQDYRPIEIVIIDQSSNTDGPLQKYVQEHGNDEVKIKYITSEVKSLTAARNNGVRNSTGEIIFSFDDDTRIPANLVSTYVKNFVEDPKVGTVTGRIDQPYQPFKHFTEGRVGRVTPFSHFIDNWSSHTRCEVDTAHGCGSAYRRAAVEKAGGWDESFRGNAYREDSDITFRIRAQGYKAIFDPSVTYTHLLAPTGGGRAKKNRIDWYYDFFNNDALFFFKNQNHWYAPLFFLSKLRPILACMFYYGKGHPRALATPFKGYRLGYKAYRSWIASGKPRGRVKK